MGKTLRPTYALLALSVALIAIAIVAASRQPSHTPVLPHIETLAYTSAAHVDPAVLRLVRQSAHDADRKPRDPHVRSTFAKVCHANGLLELAERAYEMALERKPRQAVLWYLLAMVQHEQGDVERALMSLDRSIALDSSHAPSHWERGFWLLDLNRLDEARAAFDRAAALDQRSAAPLVGQARIHLRRGQHEEAAVRLEQALTLIREANIDDRNERYIRSLLGAARRNLGQFDKARQDLAHASVCPDGTAGGATWPSPWLQEVMALRTGYRAALENAESLMSSGKARNAVTQLEALVRTRPNDVVALNYLAGAYAAAGQREAAFASLHSALKIEPDYFATHLSLSGLYWHHDAKLCEHHARRAVALNPTQGVSHRDLGKALVAAKKLNEAADAFRQALALGASGWETRLWLGQILANDGHWKEAERVLAPALQAAPQEAALLSTMALVQAELGHLDLAVQFFHLAAESNPSEPSLRTVAGRIQNLRRGGGGP